jgi:hypothetical protein
MKLITAIRMIKERDRTKREPEKQLQRQKMPFGNQFVNMQNPGQKKLVNVQSIFPKEDVLALKMKTKEAHIKEALLKAVYFYLENADGD